MPVKSAVIVSSPYPLLDPGQYTALCTEATFAWARQWKKWIARLSLDPQHYHGHPYQGTLCKFLSLGTHPERPRAGQHSAFRQLYVEVNGGQPQGPEVTMRIFESLLYDITVETVTRDRNGKERRPEHWYSVIREIHLSRAAPTALHANLSPANPSTEKTQTTHSTDQHSNIQNPPLTGQRVKAVLASKVSVLP
jgi:hypothetical protein